MKASPTFGSLGLVLLLAAPIACGDDVAADGAGGVGNAGAGGAGGDGARGGGGEDCELDTPGEQFTFHVTNVGDDTLGLFFGCGDYSPIELRTDDGLYGLGAENAEVCGYTCEYVYDGGTNNSCSDCGPPSFFELGSGTTTTIVWDRRVFVPQRAPAACSGHESQNECALGVRVGSEVTSGILTYCSELPQTPSCPEAELEFAIDLTADEATIEIE